MISKIGLVLRGAAMGIAEVIPGVSGGTIAFISGIYEDLIKSIKAFGPEAIHGYKSDGLRGLWNAVNGTFLIFLLGGMGLGIVFGIFTVSHLMETQPEILWGFFFGLILISCIVVAREIKTWNFRNIAAMLLGAGIAYGITVVAPAEGNLNVFYVFFSAMLAVSALMLPGISGSFVLLLLGMYTLIISTLRNFLSNPSFDNFKILAIFGVGLFVGLAVFSRVLTWLFDHYKEVVLALLTGFMLGSLNKIWPWRNVSAISDKATGNIIEVIDYKQFLTLDKDTYKILSETNVLPQSYLGGDPKTLWVILAMVLGAGIVVLIDQLGKRKI